MNATLARGTVLTLALLASGSSHSTEGSALTFEQRVAAQRAIERAYHSHQIGATMPFDQAVPRQLIEEKVRTYLAESVALEQIWHIKVTAAMLESELARIARTTRMPERLTELYAALDDDPVLVQEALVRPVLVERLTRAAFRDDPAIHAGARRRAEALRRSLLAGTLGAAHEDALRAVITYRRGEQSHSAVEAEPAVTLDGESYRRLMRSLGRVGEIGPVEDQGEAFVIRTLIEPGGAQSRVVVHRVAKVGWEEWWSQRRDEFNPMDVVAVASRSSLLPAPGGRVSPCPPNDVWINGVLDDPAVLPKRRTGHTNVWTGSVMLVFGGSDGTGLPIEGARYDPAMDVWTAMSVTGAPTGRSGHTAVWTGGLMLVFGGYNATGFANDGARYDPAADIWAPMSTANAPVGRYNHSAIWTGSRMVIWGGHSSAGYEDTGGRYDPSSDTWSSVASSASPAPRELHTAIWTGAEMVIWGGYPEGPGGRYDPFRDRWSAVSSNKEPSQRYEHTAVWTGTEMIVWGGLNANIVQGGGGRYNPATNRWSSLSPTDAPSPRYGHVAVWTGNSMIVWSGSDQSMSFNDGATYDPVADRWTALSQVNAPSPRLHARAIWTGTVMVVWHGEDGMAPSTALATGSRYDPSSNSWLPTSVFLPPSGRSGHSSVWTGNEMVVWGGNDGLYLNSGSRYDPALDQWRTMSTLDAPSVRANHSAVWTGQEMIVWGGRRASSSFPGYEALNTGGRYNPVSDTWGPVSAGLTPRYDHPAVWTGTRMFVWGGAVNSLYGGALDRRSFQARGDGGLYDPVTDVWSAVSTVNAPSARYWHSAVWNGSSVLIWGGCDTHVGSGYPCFLAPYTFSDGRIYDLATGTWSTMSLSGAPSGRGRQAAVWDGSAMLIWGGYSYFQPSLNDGAAYNPATSRWSALPSGGPAGPTNALWTGTVMLFRQVRYAPGTRLWLTNAAPPPGIGMETAVWIGDSMIVWGGGGSSTGGRYFLDNGPDGDDDGYTVCGGDCDDARASVYPGAPQTCDGTNNDCSDPSWPLLPADEADADGDGLSICAGDCDDTRATVYPGAPQICDGVNNDCSDPSWPSLLADEADADGDGRRICEGDCDDSNAQVWSAPGEAMDLSFAIDLRTLAWQTPAETGGSSWWYDTLRAMLSYDFESGTVCVESNDPSDTFASDPGEPAAGGIFYYLVRAENSCPAGLGVGPLGFASDGTPRSGRPCP